MNNRKVILYLAVGIVLLAAVNVAVFNCGEDKVVFSRISTLVDPSADVTSFRIDRRGRAPVRIARSSRWRMIEPYQAEVDEQSVMKFIDALSQTVAIDTISDSELLRIGRTRRDFELEDSPLQVRVSCGGKDIGCRFGAKTPAGDGVYASIEGVGAVFVMPSDILAAVDVAAERFRRRSLFDAVPETLIGFTVKRPAGSIVAFSRDGENWKVDGMNVPVEKVRGMLSKVLNASVRDFVWPTAAAGGMEPMSAALLATYGLDPESAVTLTVAGVDGDRRMISFGKVSSEGEVYALVQQGDAIVTVDAELKTLAMQGASAYVDARIFPFEASAVNAFVIVDGETSYSFARGKNASWRIETPVSAAADQQRMDALLNRMLTLTSADMSQSGLSVFLSSNSAPVTVSRKALLGDSRMEDLRSTEILRIDPVTVKRIVMSSSDRKVVPVSVVYNRDLRAWNLEHSSLSEKVDEKGVATVLSAVNPLLAERIERLKVTLADLSAYGLDIPGLTVAIDQDVEKSVRRNIMLGNRTEGGYYATVGSSGAVFVISDETASRISSALVGE